MIDQNSQFFAILTNVGLAKQANADALGIPWKITHMGVGDANGTDPIPSATQTKLINERRRAPLNQLKVDPANAAVIVAEQVIPEDVGGWWIREISLYDSDGDMIAIANCAPSFKPLLTQGSGRTQVVRMNMIVSNSSNVELKIDPSVVLATRAYVDSKVLEELNKIDSKQSVRVATTANIALAGLQSIDAITLVAGDRVLVKNQSVAKDNGLYVAAAGVWPRALDADTNAEVTSALLVSVEQGSSQADTRWQLVTDGVIVLGTTALTFQNVTQGFAPINSPAFTGSPTAPTAAPGTNTQQIATTAFVTAVRALLNTAIGLKAPLASPVLTGTPTAPTAAAGNNSTQIATTAFIQTALAALVDSSPDALNTLNELATALGNDPNFATTITNALGLKAPLANPTFTGDPKAPTPATGDNDTSIATTAFVQSTMNGAVGVNIAGTGSITLTAAQAGAATINLTGALTGNKTVVVPTAVGRYQICNNTTGNFTVTVKTATGAGQLITRGMSSLMFCDGATVQLQQADFISPVLRGTPTAPEIPRFENSDRIATAKALQSRGHQYANFTQFTGTLAGVLAHVGGLVHCSGATANAYTLPDSTANKLIPGVTIRVQNWGVTSLALGVQGSDRMQENIDGGWTSTTRSIPPDSYVDCLYIGTKYWLLTGTGVMGKTRVFGASLGVNGYQKLPSGLIIQWMTASFAGPAKSIVFNLPIAYPTQQLGCHVSLTGSAIYESIATPHTAGMVNGLGQVLLQSNYSASQSDVRVLSFGI
jgi:phage-related tail fiber protein